VTSLSSKILVEQQTVIYFYPRIHEVTLSACPFTLCRGFFTPKIVGTSYMQGYKVKEKTAIVPHCTPSFKTQWAPCLYYSFKYITLITSVPRELIEFLWTNDYGFLLGLTSK
jgi:hypothetical protein